MVELTCCNREPEAPAAGALDEALEAGAARSRIVLTTARERVSNQSNRYHSNNKLSDSSFLFQI